MGSILNQYSFVWIGLFVLAISAALAGRSKRRWLRAAVPGVLAVALVAVFVLLRTGDGNVRSVAEFDEALASGKPVMLELYSDY